MLVIFDAKVPLHSVSSSHSPELSVMRIQCNMRGLVWCFENASLPEHDFHSLGSPLAPGFAPNPVLLRLEPALVPC